MSDNTTDQINQEPEKEMRRKAQLVKIEQRVQEEWAKHKPYEVNAPQDPDELAKKNKFMVTFPFPYMNGALHLGHTFSVLKAEFAVRFQRLLGKNTLFPFGFHCTGMPILACAKRLREELERFGPQGPPDPSTASPEEEDDGDDDHEDDGENTNDAPESTTNADGTTTVKPKRRRGKLAAKATGLTYQWQIMRSMGVPEHEIAEFANTDKWLEYWPPIAKRDLLRLGLAVDWRRTFITTDVNPYFDAFVKWQFEQLYAKNKVAFGKLMCIYSPASESVCADHDRTEGEGIVPQDYTLIKLQLQQPYPSELTEILTKNGVGETVNIVLPAATLRPETMYGQTNAFLKPDGDYGIYRMNDNEVFICSDRSASNMSYQDIFGPVNGVAHVNGKHNDRRLGSILGGKLLGRAVSAPLAKYDHVYLLPLSNILMDKGTGVVTSVPSDAPMDYAAFHEIKNKPEYFQKTYNLDVSILNSYEVVEVISVKEGDVDTNSIARLLCENAKVTTHRDDKLAALKDESYRLGFEKGVMLVGKYVGEPVKEAKDKVKADMIADGTAIAYAEPEGRVISRMGEECVCALVDQWFLTYGEESWKQQVRSHVADGPFNSYNPQIKSKLLGTIEWLMRWGCSRAFGLGSRLPFDNNYLIESLSDSTIYMAYYTICNILQGEVLKIEDHGKKSNITPDQLTSELFDYIFLEKPYDADKIKISQDVCDQMRREFEYWYPFDLRVSGKDLLNNHLVMALYNHAAIWDAREDRMPGGYYANGLLLIDGMKMSKGTGNFLVLEQAIDIYGADAIRFGLASSGDSLEDANFNRNVADGAILKLTRELDTMNNDYIPGINNGHYRTGELNFWDKACIARINKVTQEIKHAYETMTIFDVVRGFHLLTHVRDEYRVAITPEGGIVTRKDWIDDYHKDVIIHYLRVISTIMSPIVPHWAQEIHETLQREGFTTSTTRFVADELWPESEVPDPVVLDEAEYILAQSDALRAAHSKVTALNVKKFKGKTPPPLNRLDIYVATSYPDWQKKVLAAMSEYLAKQGPDPSFQAFNDLSQIRPIVAGLFEGKQKQSAMKFLSETAATYQKTGPSSLNLEVTFNELQSLITHSSFLIRAVDPITSGNSETFSITAYDPEQPIMINGRPLQNPPIPGKPCYVFNTI